MSHLSADPTARFTGRAADYAKYRPSYPAAAIDAVLEGLGDPRALTIVDVGAGTGISTRLLAERGAHVIGLEPNEEMRKTAEAAGLETHAGRAEASGLLDAAYDAVTAFQAFHWFGTVETLEEFKRILRPGGRVALVWNIRDDSDEFTNGYGEIFDRERENEIARSFHFNWNGVLDLMRAAALRNPRMLAFPSVQRVDNDGLLGRASSASYVPAEGARRDEILGKLAAWHDRFAGPDGRVDLKYQTKVHLGER